jgi:hypothetical protein
VVLSSALGPISPSAEVGDGRERVAQGTAGVVRLRQWERHHGYLTFGVGDVCEMTVVQVFVWCADRLRS